MKIRRSKPTGNTITSLPPSPTDDRHARMVKYLVAMLIRLICVILCFPVPGWYKLIPAVGAVVLPYVAVVLANVGHDGRGGEVTRPGGLELYRPQPTSSFPSGEQATPREPAYQAQDAPPQSPPQPSSRPQPSRPAAAPRQAPTSPAGPPASPAMRPYDPRTDASNTQPPPRP